MALYAQTSGTHQTNSGSFVPIPGLSITIPEGAGTQANNSHDTPAMLTMSKMPDAREADFSSDMIFIPANLEHAYPTT